MDNTGKRKCISLIMKLKNAFFLVDSFPTDITTEQPTAENEKPGKEKRILSTLFVFDKFFFLSEQIILRAEALNRDTSLNFDNCQEEIMIVVVVEIFFIICVICTIFMLQKLFSKFRLGIFGM